MEEYVTKLSKLLERNPQGVESINLDYYFDSVNERNFLEILGNNDLWNKVFYKVEKHYNSNKFLAPHDESVCDNIFKLIVAIQNTEDKQQKVLLLLLIVYLDDTLLLTQHLIHKGFFTNVLDKIFSILGNINLNASISTSDLHWESEMFKKYQSGIKNNNIVDIYGFIFAYERGYNFIPDSFINVCMLSLSQLSTKKATELLEDKNNVLLMRQLIIGLPNEIKLQLANCSNNQLLKFEALREVVYFQRTARSLSYKEQGFISDIILSFSDDDIFWAQFLTFYLEYPSRAPLLFQPLGNVLNQLNEKHWRTFASKVHISKYNDPDSKQALNIFFNDIQDEKASTMVSKMVFQEWEIFIDNHSGFLNNILTTDVIDIVIYHIINNLSKKEVESTLMANLDIIHEINNRWFKSELEQTALFYKSMSKIFVYGMAIEKHSLNKFKKLILVTLNECTACNKGGHQYENNTCDLFNKYILKNI